MASSNISKSPFFFADQEQANLRLSNAVILYEGHPYWVYDVTPGDKADDAPVARMYKCPVNVSNPTGTIRRNLDDKGFGSFQPISPGMINFFEGCPFTGRVSYHASFLDRVPVRRTKQGLARENTRVLNFKDNVDFRGLISSNSFVDMVKGEYPLYSDAVDALVVDSSIAVSRKYGLCISDSGAPLLIKETKPVGLFRGKDEILLYPKAMYLREEIIETPNLPNNINPF